MNSSTRPHYLKEIYSPKLILPLKWNGPFQFFEFISPLTAVWGRLKALAKNLKAIKWSLNIRLTTPGVFTGPSFFKLLLLAERSQRWLMPMEITLTFLVILFGDKINSFTLFIWRRFALKDLTFLFYDHF